MKPCIIKIGNNQALSIAVQRMLFSMDTKWVDGGTDISTEPVARYGAQAALRISKIDNNSLTYGDYRDIVRNDPEYRSFDAATQFGELITYLNEPDPPSIYVGNHLVHFEKDHIMVGCQRVEWSTVKEVYDRIFKSGISEPVKQSSEPPSRSGEGVAPAA